MDTRPPKAGIFVLGHATILPAPFAPPILDGAIAIKGSKIIALGQTADVVKSLGEHFFIDASQKLIIPGLFNAHTHVSMGFFRGLGHGKTNMIESFLFPAEKSLTPELLTPLSYSYILDGLRSGVTSFADHYYFSEGIGRAFERMGVRAWLGETVADLGGAFPGKESWTRARALIEKSNFSSRIRPVVAPHAMDTISPSLLTEIAEWAHTHNIPLHMHLSQTDGEYKRVKTREGRSPVEVASSCKALGPRSFAVHLTSATETDIKIIADSGATIGWCPGSTIIYDKLAPVKSFIEHKIPLAIGTDCAASNDSADILAELRTAALLGKHIRIPDQLWSADHLFAMATTNPAKVLGVETQLGQLAKNYTADLVLLDVGLSALPIQNPLVNVIYSMGSRDVTHVMIDGQWILWNREFTKANVKDLEAEYMAAVQELTTRIISE